MQAVSKSLELTEDHVAKRSKVGHINGLPVFEILTTGGFNMIVAARKGAFETLGTGPHRAVARHIAMKIEPKITFTDLNKADHVEPGDFALELPYWENITARQRALQGL